MVTVAALLLLSRDQRVQTNMQLEYAYVVLYLFLC